MPTSNSHPQGHALFQVSEGALTSWIQGTSELAMEMGNFARSRMEADWKTVAKLMSCRDPGSIFQCQCEAAEKAVKDYLDEAGKLAGLATNLALSSHRLPSASSKATHAA